MKEKTLAEKCTVAVRREFFSKTLRKNKFHKRVEVSFGV